MKKIYVNNDEFYDLLVDYRSTESRKSINEISKIFMRIANNLKYKPCFINYTENIKTEMVSDAIYHMLKYMNSYDLDYGRRTGKNNNPFSYFTMIAWNSFVGCIKKLHRDSEIFTSIDFIDAMGDGEGNVVSKIDSEYLNQEERRLGDILNA